MKRMNVLVLALLASLPATADAQQGQGGQAVVTPQGQPQQVFRRGREAEAANVRLDITINDQSAGGKPAKKSITMLIADRGDGRVRSTGTLTQEWVQPGMVSPDGKPLVSVRPVGEVQLNVDASVEMLEADRIRTRLTIEYTPGGSDPLPAGSAVTRSPLNQSVTVILTNGKPLVITQAADPLSDRKITVEVTATILR